jgi:UDP-N-acetylmuramyl tripeptide synthase
VLPSGVRTLTYSTAKDVSDQGGHGDVRPNVWARDIRTSRSGTSANLTFSNIDSQALGRALPQPLLEVRGIGAHFIENAMAAMLASHAAGVPLADALETLRHAELPPGRFEVLDADANANANADADTCIVVDYAHTPDAILRTVETALSLASHVTVVFGAGGDRDKAKRPLMGHAASAATRLLITSDNPRSEDPLSIAQQLRRGVVGKKAEIVLDRKVAIERAIREAPKGGMVLLLGKGHEKTPFSDVEWARAVTQGARVAP